MSRPRPPTRRPRRSPGFLIRRWLDTSVAIHQMRCSFRHARDRISRQPPRTPHQPRLIPRQRHRTTSPASDDAQFRQRTSRQNDAPRPNVIAHASQDVAIQVLGPTERRVVARVVNRAAIGEGDRRKLPRSGLVAAQSPARREMFKTLRFFEGLRQCAAISNSIDSRSLRNRPSSRRPA